MSGPSRTSLDAYITCDTHGKRLYPSRKIARRAARDAARSGPESLRCYRCTVLDGYHIGHLPLVVRTGQFTTADVYGPPGPQRPGLHGGLR
jgi:hypothetical protein